MKKLLWILLVAALLLFSFSAGGYLNPRTETVEIPVRVVETVIEERIVEVPAPYEVRVFTTELERFESYAELEEWLRQIQIELWEDMEPGWVCRDFAWWLFERAIEEGYLMAYHSIRPETYNAVFTRQISTAHAINATFINGYTYLIEPQDFKVFPDFEIE